MFLEGEVALSEVEPPLGKYVGKKADGSDNNGFENFIHSPKITVFWAKRACGTRV